MSRLVQLLLHHRHRDLADFEEVADRHFVGASSAARHALGGRGRVVRSHPLAGGYDAVLPPLKVGHRQRVDRPRRPRLWRSLPGHDRVATAGGRPVTDDDARRGRLVRPTAAAAEGAEAAAMTQTRARGARTAYIELSDEEVEEQFDDERRDVEQAVHTAAAEQR